MTSAAPIAELAQVDALPCAQIEAVSRNRNVERDASHRAFEMAGHIVVAFVGVTVVWLAIGHKTVENGVHVDTHVGVEILIDGKRATGVPYKKVEQTRLGQIGQICQYLTGYQMTTALARL